MTYIFFNVVQTTIIGDESSNLLSIFNKLNPSTFSDGRVRLLSFNASVKREKKLVSTNNIETTGGIKPKQIHITIFFLTSSQGQCPLHVMTQQKVSSIHFQDGISYRTCQPTFVSYGGTSTCDQLPYHESSCRISPSTK